MDMTCSLSKVRGPLPNSAAGSLRTSRNFAHGRYAKITGRLLIYIRVSSSRGRFSGPNWILSLLSGRCAVGSLGALLLAVSAAAHAQSVLTYHGGPDRSGHYV